MSDVYLYNRNVVYSIQVVYKKIMTKEYINIRLEVGSPAHEIVEEAIRNNKVISRYLSERLESIEQKKYERMRFEFDVFLGMIETYSDNETKRKINYFWPLFVQKFVNKKPIDDVYISELIEMIQNG